MKVVPPQTSKAPDAIARLVSTGLPASDFQSTKAVMQKITIVKDRAVITGESPDPIGALPTLNKNPAKPNPPKTA